MREIANIADSLSIDKMDCRDRRLLDEIKNTIHECLIDVVGESRKVRRKNPTKRRKLDDSFSSKDGYS